MNESTTPAPAEPVAPQELASGRQLILAWLVAVSALFAPIPWLLGRGLSGQATSLLYANLLGTIIIGAAIGYIILLVFKVKTVSTAVIVAMVIFAIMSFGAGDMAHTPPQQPVSSGQ
jgi:hypothetical protein